MRSEDEFRRHVIKVAEDMGGHVSHIESHQTSAGVPDLNIRLFGEDIWLELKVVKDGRIKMRPPQKKWHRDRNEAGGRSYVWALYPATGYVLELLGHMAAQLPPALEPWMGHAYSFNANDIDTSLKLIAMEIKHVRVEESDRNRTAQSSGSPEIPLPASGPDVDGHHWLHSKP